MQFKKAKQLHSQLRTILKTRLELVQGAGSPENNSAFEPLYKELPEDASSMTESLLALIRTTVSPEKLLLSYLKSLDQLAADTINTKRRFSEKRLSASRRLDVQELYKLQFLSEYADFLQEFRELLAPHLETEIPLNLKDRRGGAVLVTEQGQSLVMLHPDARQLLQGQFFEDLPRMAGNTASSDFSFGMEFMNQFVPATKRGRKRSQRPIAYRVQFIMSLEPLWKALMQYPPDKRKKILAEILDCDYRTSQKAMNGLQDWSTDMPSSSDKALEKNIRRAKKLAEEMERYRNSS